jgi:phytoene desaturase
VTLGSGEQLLAEIVVSNCDPLHRYGQMLPGEPLRLASKLKLGRSSLSMGLFVLFFGARRQWPDVAHHTIWFGHRHEDLLRDIFDRKILTEDFSLYLHRPTATDASFAPAGQDSFYVLCPVPNLTAEGIDWAVEGPRLRDRIVASLDRTLLPGLRETICSEFWMTPEDFRDRYSSHAGTGFSVAPIFTQSAYFRFHNRGEGVEGLYLTGAGTHPGAGMPGVILSAKVMDRLIEPVAA